MHRIASLAFSKSHISSIWAVLFTTNITTKPPFEMPPPETSARPVYLISFPAVRGEYSQWAFFVPHTGDDQGKYFNAVNTPSTGFAVEIEADKDLSRTNRQFTKNLLGYVSVNDSVLEDLANRTTPLGISPADLQPSPDCQTWLRSFVAALVAAGILDASAVEMLNLVHSLVGGI